MPVSDEEAKQVLNEVRKVAQPSTDTLIRFDDSGTLVGLGSCLYVLSRDGKRSIGVTCNHVLKDGTKYFVGAERLDKPMIPRSELHEVPAVKVIQRFPQHDLAFFDLDGIDLSVAKKSAIDLSSASAITSELLRRNLSNAMVIFGVPGYLAEFTKVDSSSIYAELPIYTALGPLVDVDEDSLIGDFTEKKLLFANTAAFPKLEGDQATVGSRDLSGMSGSGGWIKSIDGIRVIGILARPKEATESRHVIQFVPIWKVISSLNEIG